MKKTPKRVLPPEVLALRRRVGEEHGIEGKDLTCFIYNPYYLPSQAEIAERCRELRGGWSDTERQHRYDLAHAPGLMSSGHLKSYM